MIKEDSLFRLWMKETIHYQKALKEFNFLMISKYSKKGNSNSNQKAKEVWFHKPPSNLYRVLRGDFLVVKRIKS